MKKLFAILLAVAMIMSFALTASAEEDKTFTANLMYLDGDGNDFTQAGSVTTKVDGSGTYTMTFDASISADGAWGAVMLYVQIDDAYDVLKDWEVSDVKLSVDGADKHVSDTVTYVDPVADLGAATTATNAIYVYHSTVQDCTNDFIIELANFYAGFSVKHGSGIDFGGASREDATWIAEESITVTFTLTDPNEVKETEPAKSEDKDDTDATSKPTSKPDSSNAQTGDASSLFVALMAVSAMGIAVVAKKKH